MKGISKKCNRRLFMSKRLRKRAISIVLMLTMVFTLLPTTAINAYAAEDICDSRGRSV